MGGTYMQKFKIDMLREEMAGMYMQKFKINIQVQ